MVDKKDYESLFMMLLATTFLLFFGVVLFVPQVNRVISYISHREEENLDRISLTWLTNNDPNGYRGILDSNDSRILNVNPDENIKYNSVLNPSGGIQVSYQLMFNIGGEIDAPKSAVKIYLPKNIFYDRSGNAIASQIVDIPLVAAPDESGTGYNYSIEVVNNEEYIVLSNYLEIPSSYTFECSFTWILPTPSLVADGFQKDVIAHAVIDFENDGTNDLDVVSNQLKMKYFSHASIDNFNGGNYPHNSPYNSRSSNVYEEWNSSWSNLLKPSNSEDYVYSIWYTSVQVKKATQPYNLEFSSTLNDSLGGEVIGYCVSSTFENPSGCFYSGVTVGTTYVKEVTTPNSSLDNSDYDKFQYIHVMVKYPKATLMDGTSHRLRNRLTVILTGAEGGRSGKYVDSTSDYYYSVIEPVTENVDVPFVPRTSNYISQSGSAYSEGGINILESNKSVFAGNHGDKTNTTANYTASTTLGFYALTRRETGYMYDPRDYQYYNWDAVLVDDTMIMGTEDTGFETLNEGDYQFTTIALSSLGATEYVSTTWSTYNSSTKVTTNYNGYTTRSIALNDLPSVRIYYKLNDEWVFFAEAVRNSSYSDSFDYTLADGTVYTNLRPGVKNSNDCYGIPLPEGVAGVKAIASSKYYSVSLSFAVHAELIPTSNVKRIIKRKPVINLFNYAASYAIDHNGSICGTGVDDTGPYQSLPSGLLGEALAANDMAKYERNLYHYHYPYTVVTDSNSTGYHDHYTRINGGDSLTNEWVLFNNDSSKRRVVADYTAVVYERVTFDHTILSAQSVMNHGIINEQRGASFYILLPRGMDLGANSITVETLATTGNVDYVTNQLQLSAGTNVPITVSQVENWRRSGRTMVIVNAVIEDETTVNWFEKNNYLLTGFVIKYKGYYHWDGISDYGKDLINTMAYKSLSGKLSQGCPDDASTLDDSYHEVRYFTDLDQDGNEHAVNDTIYVLDRTTVSFNTASDTFFKTMVKTPSVDEYVYGATSETEVMAGGFYTYRLRYASQKNITTKDLIIYDILEDYDGGPKWKGTIVSVDLSQPREKGSNPVIYYSVKKSSTINIYEHGKVSIDEELPEGIMNIDSHPYWTTERPDDLSKITAIAFDFSKDSRGRDFVIQDEDSIVVTIKMKAPVTNVSQLIAQNAKAYNSGWWSGVTQQGNEEAHRNLTVFEYTQVSLSLPDIEISKTATDVNNTDGDNTTVLLGSTLLYDIAIHNKNSNQVLEDIQLTDNMPSNVEVKESEISFYIEGYGSAQNAALISSSSRVSMSKSKSKYNFVVSDLLAGEKMHILIPTTPLIKDNKVIENQVTLTGFNNMEYDDTTEKTVNRIPTGNLIIKKEVEGVYDNPDKLFEFKIKLISPDRYQTMNSRMIGQELERKARESDGEETQVSFGESVLALREIRKSLLFRDESTSDPIIKGKIGGLSFTNGIATFTLGSGGVKELKDLPAGFYYEISENDYSKEGFMTTFTNNKGIIHESQTTNVEFINSYDIENPFTSVPKIFFLACVSFASVVVWKFYRKKRKINA